MTAARVVGTVTATMKHAHYEGKKLLVVKPVDIRGEVQGKSFIAVDAVQAGIGDLVLVIDEGGSAREMLEYPEGETIRAVAAGIIDRMEDERREQ